MQTPALQHQRIAVLLGGSSAEREVSLETGNAVLGVLVERGYNATAFDVDQTVGQRLLEARIDVAFVALHGGHGEDGCIQGLLEIIGIPYTGAGVLASAMAMDKVVTKRLAQLAGIPTAAWAFPADNSSEKLGFPLVLKPRAEGSSVGVSIVQDAAELARQLADEATPMMAERYVPGRELSAAVIGRAERASCLGTIEVRPAKGFYDYEAKYQRDDTDYVVAPELPPAVDRQLREQSLAVHRLLECGGVTRVDFRWDGAAEPQLLEINTLPGLTSHSLVPKIAQHAGVGYGELVERILEDAALKA